MDIVGYNDGMNWVTLWDCLGQSKHGVPPEGYFHGKNLMTHLFAKSVGRVGFETQLHPIAKVPWYPIELSCLISYSYCIVYVCAHVHVFVDVAVYEYIHMRFVIIYDIRAHMIFVCSMIYVSYLIHYNIYILRYAYVCTF